MPHVTHLRHGAFAARYGIAGNRGALYGLKAPITVSDLRAYTALEKAAAAAEKGA